MTDVNRLLLDVLNELTCYIREEDFAGWDPYDGLNSEVFNVLPFKNNSYYRLVFSQLLKRCPFNLRPFLIIRKERNPKGIALFASGFFNLYKILKKEEYLKEGATLLSWLENMKRTDFSGFGWGYNFPWQSRYHYKPKFYPNAVVTSFVGQSFLDGYNTTENSKYLEIAKKAADFLLNEVMVVDDDSVYFSYSPSDSSQVINVTALVSVFLAHLHYYTQDALLRSVASRGIKFVIKKQNEDGSWYYGTKKYQQWIDNFHTAFNLLSLKQFSQYINDFNFREELKKAYDYYTKTFFMEDGRVKYYNDKLYPIDIHAIATAIITLSKFGDIDLAKRVLNWAIKHMWDKEKKYFYFQKHRLYTIKISYMRWSQAWMFLALTEFLKDLRKCSG
ncbi:delta-aminolevulinic acid dehydratase [Thermococci archaeon]|nr:MAG: delta-aminolevulinic acid dehydratase [Thermococci archaeon]